MSFARGAFMSSRKSVFAVNKVIREEGKTALMVTLRKVLQKTEN
jgi:hypothetical protein